MKHPSIPGYRILEVLGQGGMATVYLAIQESFEREVALKVLSPDYAHDESFTERFIRESRIVSRLVHTNIVTVYDVGVVEGYHYLSMEYIPGKDLKQALFGISIEKSLRVIREIAMALDYAGRKGYVHRDVKPENIMLHEEDGRAILMDFGIARASDTVSNMTQTGMAIGTPHYMSPEQAKGASVDPRSDIYSLGVVMFLLLTGRVPFDADSAVAVGIKHLSDPVPALPPNLRIFQQIIDRAMAKQADNRFQSGVELCRALDEITADDLTAADNISRKPIQIDRHSSDEHAVTVLARATPAPAAQAMQALHSRDDDDDVLLEEAIHISHEDRGNPFGSESHWPRYVFLLFVLAAGLGWYLQDHLGDEYNIFAKLGLPHPQEVLPQDWVESDKQTAVEQTVAAHRPPEKAPAPAKAAARQPSTAASAKPEPTKPLAQNPKPAVSGGDPASIEDSPAVEASANAEPALMPAADFATRVEQLWAEIESRPDNAITLANLYRRPAAGTEAEASEGLQKLQRWLNQRGTAQMDAGDFSGIKATLDIAQRSFPEGLSATLQQLEKEAQRGLLIADHIDKARRYLADDALSSPAGANVLEELEAVGLLDPNNPAAAEIRAQVPLRYLELARLNVEKGRWRNAQSLVAKGLGMEPDNHDLLALRQSIGEQQERQKQFSQWLSQAHDLAERGRYLAPPGESAYDRYHSILSLDPKHSEAQKGMQRLQQLIIADVNAMIDAGNLDAAQDELAPALRYFPDSEEIKSAHNRLDAAFEKAMAAVIEACKPKVPRMQVSAVEINSLAATPQRDLANVGRTLHIRFEYLNFKTQTSVLQAALYDGARQVKIAQVPVVITGSEGEANFRIERPVEGYSTGSYAIELSSNGFSLATTTFRVQN